MGGKCLGTSLVSRKLIQAHEWEACKCLGTSNATSKRSDYSVRPRANSSKSVDPHPTRGSTPTAQYGKALGECSRSTSAAQVRPGHDHRLERELRENIPKLARIASRKGRLTRTARGIGGFKGAEGISSYSHSENGGRGGSSSC
jgi:hypothetical protein